MRKPFEKKSPKIWLWLLQRRRCALRLRKLKFESFPTKSTISCCKCSMNYCYKYFFALIFGLNNFFLLSLFPKKHVFQSIAPFLPYFTPICSCWYNLVTILKFLCALFTLLACLAKHKNFYNFCKHVYISFVYLAKLALCFRQMPLHQNFKILKIKRMMANLRF